VKPPDGTQKPFLGRTQDDMHGPHIYKRNQGKYTRLTTAISVMVLVAWGCFVLSEKLGAYRGVNTYVRFGIPLVILVGMGVLMFWLVNRPKSADFLIATEGEMKKVSWSSRKEVIGSTKVVIVTTFILAAILFLIDVVFASVFKAIGISG
jgi:preprotein translocase subunit SecE